METKVKVVTENERKLFLINLHNCIVAVKDNHKLYKEIGKLKVRVKSLELDNSYLILGVIPNV